MGVLKLVEEAEEGAVASQGIIQYLTSSKYITAKLASGILSLLSHSRLQKNYLYNAGFAVRQKVAAALTSFIGSTTVRQVITIDRWGHTTGNATTPQFQQVDTNATIEAGITARYYALWKQITNAAKICVSQVIPCDDCLHLRGKKVRLQIKLRKSVGADKIICIGIVQLTSVGTFDALPATFISAFNGAGVDPTFGTNLALIAPDADKLDNTTVVGNKLNCAITTAWQRFGGVFTLPTNFKNLVVVIFSNDVLAAADDLLMTEASLTDGQDIVDWEDKNFAIDLEECQRFYQKSFNYGVVPANNAGVAGSKRNSIQNAGAVATSWNGAEIRFPVVMRAAPTMTLYNPSAANAFVRNITLATDATVTAAANIGDAGAHVNCTGLAAWVVGNDSAIHWSATAEL